MTPPVTFLVSQADVEAFWRHVNPRKRSSLVVRILGFVFYVIVSLIMLAMLRNNVEPPDASPMGAAVWGVIVGIVGMLWLAVGFAVVQTPRDRRRHYRGLLVARGPVNLSADDTAVEATQAGIVSTYPWTSFLQLAATRTHFFLYIARYQALIIPCAAVVGTPLGVLVEAHVARGPIRPDALAPVPATAPAGSSSARTPS